MDPSPVYETIPCAVCGTVWTQHDSPTTLCRNLIQARKDLAEMQQRGIERTAQVTASAARDAAIIRDLQEILRDIQANPDSADPAARALANQLGKTKAELAAAQTQIALHEETLGKQRQETQWLAAQVKVKETEAEQVGKSLDAARLNVKDRENQILRDRANHLAECERLTAQARKINDQLAAQTKLAESRAKANAMLATELDATKAERDRHANSIKRYTDLTAWSWIVSFILGAGLIVCLHIISVLTK